jgi:hypothetical protein
MTNVQFSMTKECPTPDPQPGRAKENSPPIYRWDTESNPGKSREGRQNSCATAKRAVLQFALILFVLLPISTCLAQNSTGSVHFQAVDIFVDAKDIPLAAYQLEFKATNGNVKIVGIEGGEHSAFKEAPYYDPKAMQQERVIIAAFSTDANLPRGKTRVATIHLQIIGDQNPGYSVKLAVAADAGGNKTPADATFEERTKP